MRRYTLVFMEQRMGAARLMPVEGEAGSASFAAIDDEEALFFINDQLLDRLKHSVRGELSSMRMQPDAGAPGGMRLVDDCHSRPQFQDSYVKYNATSKTAEFDFESTRTTLMDALDTHTR